MVTTLLLQFNLSVRINVNNSLIPKSLPKLGDRLPDLQVLPRRVSRDPYIPCLLARMCLSASVVILSKSCHQEPSCMKQCPQMYLPNLLRPLRHQHKAWRSRKHVTYTMSMVSASKVSDVVVGRQQLRTALYLNSLRLITFLYMD